MHVAQRTFDEARNALENKDGMTYRNNRLKKHNHGTNKQERYDFYPFTPATTARMITTTNKRYNLHTKRRRRWRQKQHWWRNKQRLDGRMNASICTCQTNIHQPTLTSKQARKREILKKGLLIDAHRTPIEVAEILKGLLDNLDLAFVDCGEKNGGQKPPEAAQAPTRCTCTVSIGPQGPYAHSPFLLIHCRGLMQADTSERPKTTNMYGRAAGF